MGCCHNNALKYVTGLVVKWLVTGRLMSDPGKHVVTLTHLATWKVGQVPTEHVGIT